MEASALPGRKPLLLALCIAGLCWAVAVYEMGLPVGGGTPHGMGGSLAGEALQTGVWLALCAVIVSLLVLGGYAYLWRIIRRNAVQIELQRRIIEQTSDAMMVVDAERRIILAVNPAFERITGFASGAVVGASPDLLVAAQDNGAADACWRDALNAGEWQGEILGRRQSGELYPKRCSIRAVPKSAGQDAYFVAVFADLTGEKAQEARIEYLLQHDPLTGLPNRLALEEQIGSNGMAGRVLVLLIIDLDNFKTINDSLGHHAGDRLLCEVAERIRGQLDAQAELFRLGGDEFAVLLQGNWAFACVHRLVPDIVKAIGQPCQLGESCLHVTPSIGIACAPQDGIDAQTLIRNADTAMYAAKAAGRNGYRFFTDRMGERVNQRLRMESELWQALAEQQLVLHYQPQYELLTGRHVGVEALIRWQHPQLGLIPPVEFVPLAEECGLILALGQWVLVNACNQAKRWLDKGIDMGEVAINISPQQFRQPDFAQVVRDVLNDTGLPPERLELEITESAVVHDVDAAIAILGELKAMGVRLAIDDFGTGYSSLSYLRRFPVNRLKIDRAFVADVETDAAAAALVSSIVAMGRSLGLEMVAEGVENEAQADFLRILECERGQGFHFRRPVAADEVFPGRN